MSKIRPAAKNWPTQGWSLRDFSDLGTATHECEYCTQTHIRYVHYLVHQEARLDAAVGCICSGHLTGDIEGAKAREAGARLKAARTKRAAFKQLKLAARRAQTGAVKKAAEEGAEAAKQEIAKTLAEFKALGLRDFNIETWSKARAGSLYFKFRGLFFNLGQSAKTGKYWARCNDTFLKGSFESESTAHLALCAHYDKLKSEGQI